MRGFSGEIPSARSHPTPAMHPAQCPNGLTVASGVTNQLLPVSAALSAIGFGCDWRKRRGGLYIAAGATMALPGCGPLI